MQDEIIDRFSFKVEKPSKTFSNLLLIRSRSWSCGCLLSSRLLTRFSTCSICWVNNSIISSARFFIPSSLFSDACTIMGKLELCQHLRNITVLQAEVLQWIPPETSREQWKQKNEALESYKKPSQSRQKIYTCSWICISCCISLISLSQSFAWCSANELCDPWHLRFELLEAWLVSFSFLLVVSGVLVMASFLPETSYQTS